MRPEISNETVRFLDMAVNREVSNSAFVQQLDTETKIQVLIDAWVDAERERAKAEADFAATWKAPWDGPDKPNPPW